MVQDNYEVYHDDHIVELRSKDIDLKITSDRVLWHKKPGESLYTSTGKKVPRDMTKLKKELWLADLRRKWLLDQGDERGAEPEPERNDEIHVTIDDEED